MDFDFINQMVNPEDGLTENEKKEFRGGCHTLAGSQALKRIIDHIINVQGNYIARKAQSMEQVGFARATINAAELIREEVKRLNGLWLEENVPDEDYDKHEII